VFDYTAQLERVIADIVARCDMLSHVDARRLVVFARRGRTGTSGPLASCHSVNLPPSEPGYYYWWDLDTGRWTRRSPWFVTRSPRVCRAGRPVAYLLSFSLPRFCDQRPSASKIARYGTCEPWLAKLDTIVHELSHIDPSHRGLRLVADDRDRPGSRLHTRGFFARVAEAVHAYLASGPDPELLDFLRHDFTALRARFGGVVATTFRSYPSFPQAYRDPLRPQPKGPSLAVVPLTTPRRVRFTEMDLVQREFLPDRTRRIGSGRPSRTRAA